MKTLPALRIFNLSPTLLLLLALCISPNTHSVEIVRLQFTYDALLHNMDIELFDNAAPLTVANYLSYVNTFDGVDYKYNGTFIYRNLPGFVLQTGGYTFRPPFPATSKLIDHLAGPGKEGLARVTQAPPIVNEFNQPNLRGTIAMAKIPPQFVEGAPCEVEGPGCTLIAGTGADSATSEWFINLSDNLELDTQNSGFSVFGRIIDDGLTIADEISAFPIRPFAGAALGPDFTNLPVVNYILPTSISDPFPSVFQENLVMITNISQINRPIIRLSPDPVELPVNIVADGIDSTLAVVVTNTGNQTLIIDPLTLSSLSLPLSIDSENCSGKTLDPVHIAPTSSCTINFLFSPTTVGTYTNTLVIDYKDTPTAPAFTATFKVTGQGTSTEPDLRVSQPIITFASILIDEVSNEVTTNVQNKGSLPLNINAINLTGTDRSNFVISSNSCIGTGATLLFDEQCSVSVRFEPSTEGNKTAALTLETNDLIKPIFNISLTGTSNEDLDGVASAIEASSPNSGDGNNDGIADRLQSNVASIETTNNAYITLASDKSFFLSAETVFLDVHLSQLNPVNKPDGAIFNYGLFGHTIALPQGDGVNVGIFLPDNKTPTTFYKFGTTSDDPSPHWYNFAYDETTGTGAKIFGVVTHTSPSGKSTQSNLVIISYIDGQRGDDDLEVNGRIINSQSGLSFPVPDTNSGSMSYLPFMILFVINLLRHTRNRRGKNTQQSRPKTYCKE